MLLFVTYYFQGTLNFTAIQSGLAFLPWLAAFTTMAQVGSNVIAKRVGPRWTIAPGVAIVGIALVMLSHLGVSSDYTLDILPALVLFGAGAGLTISTAVNAATSAVAQSDAGTVGARQYEPDDRRIPRYGLAQQLRRHGRRKLSGGSYRANRRRGNRDDVQLRRGVYGFSGGSSHCRWWSRCGYSSRRSMRWVGSHRSARSGQATWPGEDRLRG
jgi:hypothetical protein